MRFLIVAALCAVAAAAPQFQAQDYQFGQNFQPAAQDFQAAQFPQQAYQPQQFQQVYQPQQYQQAYQPQQYQQAYQPQQYQQQQASGNYARILSYSANAEPSGRYYYQYETENGIKAEEEGDVQQRSGNEEAGTVVRGAYAYTAPDGQQIQVSYTADENGFHPEGSHIPSLPSAADNYRRQ